jgi:hypothetical protein
LDGVTAFVGGAFEQEVRMGAMLRRAFDKTVSHNGRWWLGVCGDAVESNQTFQGMKFREWVGATVSPLNCLAMGFTPPELGFNRALQCLLFFGRKV